MGKIFNMYFYEFFQDYAYIIVMEYFREKRTNALTANYGAIRNRLQATMDKCAEMSTTVIENYIKKILEHNQEKYTNEVCKLLDDRFADIYPTKIAWIFYTAWDFNPVSGDQEVRNEDGQSYSFIYQGLGKSGVTKYGGWSVYWVGNPSPPVAQPTMWYQKTVIVDIVKGMEWDTVETRSALYIQKQLKTNDFQGRTPITSMIFTYPPVSATVGRTHLGGTLPNALIQRIRGVKWRFHGIMGFPYWSEVVIDVIIF